MLSESIRRHQLQSELTKLRAASHTTDIMFHCFDTETNEMVQIKAHKILFSSLSLFMKELIEAAQLKQPYETIVVTLDSFDSNVVMKLVQYIYEGKIMISSHQKTQLQYLCDVLKLNLPLDHESHQDFFEVNISEVTAIGPIPPEPMIIDDNTELSRKLNTVPGTTVNQSQNNNAVYVKKENNGNVYPLCINEPKVENAHVKAENKANEHRLLSTEHCYEYCIYVNKQTETYISGSNSHSCNLCGHSVSKRQALTIHMRMVHNMTKMFKCSFDDYITGNYHSFKLHMNSQHIKVKYQCDRCTYFSTTPQGLIRHKRVVHYNIKSYTCNLCGYAAGQKQQLSNHMKVHHYNGLGLPTNLKEEIHQVIVSDAH